MTNRTPRIFVLLCLLSLALVSCSSNDQSATSPDLAEELAVAKSAPGKSFVLQFATTAVGEERPIPPIPGSGTSTGLCFDGDLVDLATDRVIGTATDCLADILGSPDDGMALVGTTIFNLPGGTLTSRGLTTVQPILTDPTETPITHTTGAVPNAEANSIIEGTGRFANATGSVRLSGAVNLSNLDNGEITFDCVFVINLD